MEAQLSKTSRKHRKQAWLAIVSMCLLTIFFLRHTLGGLVVDALLKRLCASEEAYSVYSSVSWEGNELIIDELHIDTPGCHATIERVAIRFDLTDLQIVPHLSLIRPCLQWKETDAASLGWSSLHVPAALLRYGTLDVIDGQCEWCMPTDSPEFQPLYFQVMRDGEEVGGTLSFYEEPNMGDDPVAWIRVLPKDQNIMVEAVMRFSTERLLPFVCAYTGISLQGWERMEGAWSLSSFWHVDPKGHFYVNRIEMSGDRVSVINSARHLRLDVDAVTCSLHCPCLAQDENGITSWLAHIDAHCAVENLDVVYEREMPWKLQNVCGHLALNQIEDPALRFYGQWVSGGKVYDWHIDGQGEFDLQQHFCIDGGVRCTDRDTVIAASQFSVGSSQDRGLCLEANIQQLSLPCLAELGQSLQLFEADTWQISSGRAKGQLALEIAEPRIVHVILRDIHVEDFAGCADLQRRWYGCSGVVGGDWVWEAGVWRRNSVHALVYSGDLEVSVMGQIGYLCALQGEVAIDADYRICGQVQGSMLGAETEMTIAGDARRPKITGQATTDLAQVMLFAPKLCKEINLVAATMWPISFRWTAEPTKTAYALSSTIVTPAGQVQGGCHILLDDEIVSEGYIHAHGIDTSACQALLSQQSSDLRWEGTVAVVGTFDARNMGLHITPDQLCVATEGWVLDIPDGNNVSAEFAWTWEEGARLCMTSTLRNATYTFLPWDVRLEQCSGIFSWDSHTRRLQYRATKGHMVWKDICRWGWQLADGVIVQSDRGVGATLEFTLDDPRQGLIQATALCVGDSESVEVQLRALHDSVRCTWHWQRNKGEHRIDCATTMDQAHSGYLVGVLSELFPSTAFLIPASWQGHIGGNFLYLPDSALFTWDLRGENGIVGDLPLRGIECAGQSQGPRVKIARLRFDDWDVSCEASAGQDQIDVEAIRVCKGKDIFAQGSGTFDLATQQVRAKISSCCVPVARGRNIRLTIKDEVVFQQTDSGILRCAEISLSEPLSQSTLCLRDVSLDWRERMVSVHQADYNVSLECLQIVLPALDIGELSVPNRRVVGSFSAVWNGREHMPLSFTGSVCNGIYGWRQMCLSLQKISWRYRRGVLLWGCATQLRDTAARLSAQVTIGDPTLMCVRLTEESSGGSIAAYCTMLLDGVPKVEKVYGRAFGVDIDIRAVNQPDNASLTGRIAIDPCTLRSALPATWDGIATTLGVGPGFSLVGELCVKDWAGQDWGYFHGQLTGRQCTLLGVEIARFDADVDVRNGAILLHSLTVEDLACSIAVQRILIEKHVSDTWHMTCPFVRVQNCRPSLFFRVGQGRGVEKPFTIRNLCLRDLQGDLFDLATYTGDCSLHFTNLYRKETTMFDIPLTFFKDVGLDPSVLVPIQGELDGHLHLGKIVLRGCRGMYSEGHRTHFELAHRGCGSYIRLDGKMHIDMALRQSVLLKFGESFILGIRGTIDQPRYVLMR